MPRFHVKTYGCQMNVHDGERMAETLVARGWTAADSPEDADLVVLNTCHIREKAAEKVYSDIGRLRPLKAARPGMRIAVAGCVAQAEGAEIVARAPAVDVVVGPQAIQDLPALLDRAALGEAVVETGFRPDEKFARLPPRRVRGPSAFLTVQEGCDKFCSFCVVPYTRGAEISRPLARLVAEAEMLVRQGVREVTLLGQNVNAWHGAEGGLAALIAALARIEGLWRIRYTTSHPNDMDEALIEAHGTQPKLMPYLHLPVQSGSDRILKAMNRKHRAEDYLRLVERLRAARPDLALSSDFIVGFPGETEDDFAQTLALVEAVGFASAYSFKFSPRPGTPAADRPAVDPHEADDRLRRLQALIDRQARAAQQAALGRTVRVLWDKPGRHPGQIAGRSEHAAAVHAEGEARLIGTITPVRLVAAAPHSLRGEIVPAA
ncbi:tRNA (N6-isopentenyl adenosine(37)-C2)-methylthiotransferase MiaB [Rubellimicrobium sp. CFH 75288]|uniref:tRNA (N6-isopentenyl adenosine(37)-C2)-methylthiotransferase MiaB n=1 Tax=Rubellimicrobium sp. CFH 75288 TaxID=2697034 RepID=UPI001411D3EA|nr:tRNA (N6-isopentenyl adenosine(37)-C2)-methylthiotransferase MiaB [Rubellimicrobium sp. CFH 75288]NAZ36107.1 tRNA (N6-isopentenyl adenosine(37)-C2)-methylthiotransferase MiaB [Rubellimicrobium sp. CFH 75288]